MLELVYSYQNINAFSYLWNVILVHVQFYMHIIFKIGFLNDTWLFWGIHSLAIVRVKENSH